MRILMIAVVVLGVACNALDEKATDSGQKFVIPTDTRAVSQALRTPPPISGGTLEVSPDGRFAVAADPDRDRISIVDLASLAVHHVELAKGDEPGRVAIDAHGQAHVALRGGGALLSLDVALAKTTHRTGVCAAPRGVAFDAATDLLHVACASGQLISLNAVSLDIVRSLDLGTDLRDVIVSGTSLLVSTFKQANLLTVDAAGNVMRRFTLPTSEGVMPRIGSDGVERQVVQSMHPDLAWRMVSGGGASVLMLHQRASDSEIDVGTRTRTEDGSAAEGRSSYGGEVGTCTGIVQPGVTEISGETLRGVNISGAVLAIDIAHSSLTGRIAVAQAGSAESSAPRPFTLFDGDPSLGAARRDVGATAANSSFAVGDGDTSVAIFDNNMLGVWMVNGPTLSPEAIACTPPATMNVPGQATAVAFTPSGDLLVQSREPAWLVLMRSPPGGEQVLVELGGDSVRDTGHDIFHRDSGGGIACASCHGEGGDDGHTWLFSTVGMRRTQAVYVGLEGTAPFHWDGDMRNLGALMQEVFVGRMGGVRESKKRMAALEKWVFALRPPNPIVSKDDQAAVRGKALFDSNEVGCTGCHSGSKLSNNESYDVGTGDKGERLQVPSLRGIGYRAPFIHTGCAETLRERFDPNCGGDRHGNTKDLSSDETDDLVAYLRSL